MSLFWGAGKLTRLHFDRADGGGIVPLNQNALPASITSLIVTDQALAVPCGDFRIERIVPGQSSGTMTEFGVGMPPSSSSQNLTIGNGGGCGEDPPPPPPGGGGPAAYTLADSFHHRDHLGNLRIETDSAGLVMRDSQGTTEIGRHDYYPFGTEMTEDLGVGSRKRFTGHERDEATGLDYMLARFHGSGGGRFLSPDPLQFAKLESPQSWNLYAYVVNNPLGLVDPTGLASSEPMGVLPEPARTPTPDEQAHQACASGNGSYWCIASNAGAGGDGGGGPDTSQPTPVPESWDPSKPWPKSPDELGPDWQRDPTHKNPNGERWVNGKTGDKVDFEPGRPGLPGWRGEDHWHWVPGGEKQPEHYRPGDTIKQMTGVAVVGAVILGIIITIFAPQSRFTPVPAPGAIGPFGPTKEPEWY